MELLKRYVIRLSFDYGITDKKQNGKAARKRGEVLFRVRRSAAKP